MSRNGVELSEFLWLKFSEWAETEGVSLDNELDWGPWWDCWHDGYGAGCDEG